MGTRMRGTWTSVAALALLWACGDSTTDPPDSGVSPDGGVMQTCEPACAQGQRCLDNACVAVGPQAECGCDPTTTPTGSVCHTDYGAFSDDENVVFVDASAAAGGDGTIDTPYASIGDAVDALWAAPENTTIALAAGSFVGDVVLPPPGDETPLTSVSITIRGRCAAQTRISGALRLDQVTASGSIRIEGVTIAPDGFSLDPLDAWGECSAELEPRGVQITPGATNYTVEVEDSVIAGWCTGLYFNGTGGAAVCVHDTRVCANDRGLHFEGSSSNPTQAGACQTESAGAVLMDTLVDQNRTYGLYADRGTDTISLLGSIFELTGRVGTQEATLASREGIGAYLGGVQESALIGNAMRSNLGPALALRNTMEPGDEAEVISIANNFIADNIGAGIALQELQATTPVSIVGNTILGTVASSSGEGGDGIQVFVSAGTSFDVLLQGNTVEASSRDGLVLEGVGGTIESNEIIGSGAYGVLLQNSTATLGTNTLTGSGLDDFAESAELVHDSVDLPLPSP